MESILIQLICLILILSPFEGGVLRRGKGGTNTDGSKNTKYCSYCYQSGAFKDNFTSSAQMVNLVRGKLKEIGYGPIKRWFYSANIPRLERWKN